MRRAWTRNRENVGQLIERGVSRLKEIGYSPEFVSQTEGIWAQFMHFAGGAAKNYSDDLRWAFLGSFGITRCHRYYRLDDLKSALRTAMWILFSIWRNKRKGLVFPVKERMAPWYLHALMEYQRFCREKRGMAESTIYRYSIVIRCFVKYYCARHAGMDWNGLSGNLISQFLLALPHLKRKTRLAYMVSLRSFFRGLFCLGIIADNWSGCLPKIAAPWDSAESHRWKAEEIDRLLGVIDRSTAIGKRDYAFILVAIRLGVRSGDICSLCLEDIDWEHSAIRFMQRKTGIGIALPLLPDVGLAIIDYLRHGRPKSSRREVFLIHQLRGKKPINQKHAFFVLKKARLKAGIQIPPGVHAGFHSFRHTLATRLLEEGSAWPIISGVLGHTNPDTTQIYAKASMPLLRQVALDPEEVRYG